MSPRTGKTVPTCPCREDNVSSVLGNLVLRGSDSFCKNVFNLARGSFLCLWRSARTAQWISRSKLSFLRVDQLRTGWGCRWLTKFSSFLLVNVAVMSSPPQENKGWLQMNIQHWAWRLPPTSWLTHSVSGRVHVCAFMTPLACFISCDAAWSLDRESATKACNHPNRLSTCVRHWKSERCSCC